MTRQAGERLIEVGLADIVSYGRLFIANPDLPARFAAGAPLNEPIPGLFYGGDGAGYVDYPALSSARATSPAA
jgi:N-ethylmaleimide reductase